MVWLPAYLRQIHAGYSGRVNLIPSSLRPAERKTIIVVGTCIDQSNFDADFYVHLLVWTPKTMQHFLFHPKERNVLDILQ